MGFTSLLTVHKSCSVSFSGTHLRHYRCVRDKLCRKCGKTREAGGGRRLIGSKRKKERKRGTETAETAERRRNQTEAICFISLKQHDVSGET